MANNYVGYLNDVDLFVEAMYDEARNPNGIGKIKFCVNSSVLGGGGVNGMSTMYREIFGLNTNYSNAYYTAGTNSAATTENPKGYGNEVDVAKTILFVVNDDIQFGGGNRWEETLDKLATMENATSAVGSLLTGGRAKNLQQLAGKLGKEKLISEISGAMKVGGGAGGIQVKTLMQTIKFWVGSNDPGPFRLRFNLLATRPDMDIRRDLLAMYASVYPVSITDAFNQAWSTAKSGLTTFSDGLKEIFSGSFLSGVKQAWEGVKGAAGGGTSTALSGVISAPLGYNPVEGYMSSLSPVTAEGSGLIDLKIGKWIHIPNLVAEDFDATISKVTTRFGFPLYAKCSINLKPVRMWTISDIYDAFYSNADYDIRYYSEDEEKRKRNGTKIHNTNFGPDEGKITQVKIGSMP